MESTAWHHFVDICGVAGLLLGVVGLWVTIKTFQEAKKAKDAALEAAESAWRKSAATDFKEISQRAKDLLVHVQNRQSDLAISRASDLLQSFQVAFGRWGTILTFESLERLTLLQNQLTAVSQSLSNESIPADAASYQLLSERCHELLSVLSEEAGRIELNAEAVKNA